MRMQKQHVVVTHKGMNQHDEPTLLPAGKLVEAFDVHQPTPGLLEKRNGFSKYVRTSDVGTLSNGRSLASTGDTLVVRTSDGLYMWSAAEGKWVRKATLKMVRAAASPQGMAHGYKPSMVETADGKYRYYFAAEIGQNVVAQATEPTIGDGTSINNVTSNWYYRVVDVVSGVEIVGATAIAGVKGWQARPVVAGGYVWLFVGADVAGGRYIYAAKLNPAAPTAAPSVTTYYDAGVAGGREVDGFDARLTPSGSVVVAVVGAFLAKTGGGTADGVTSFLDTTTGLPAAATGSVGITIGTLLGQCCVQWMEDQDDSSPSAYYLLVSGGGGGIAKPRALTIHLTNLTATANVALAEYSSARPMITGYHKTGGNFVTVDSDPSDSPEDDQTFFREHTSAGALVGVSSYVYRLTVASRAFRLTGGSTWYVVAQHDDNLAHLQGTYYLVVADSTHEIQGCVLRGAAGDAAQRANYTPGTFNFCWTAPTGPITATSVTLALNSWTGQQYVTREVSFEVDKRDEDRLGPLTRAADGQEIVIPGAWPRHLVAGSRVLEYEPYYPRTAPPMAPVYAATGARGLPTGAYFMQYLFAARDPKNDVHRGKPSPATRIVIDVSPDVDPMVFRAVSPDDTVVAIPARLATAGPLPACTPSVAIGVGKTLTANANGALTVDGVAVIAADVVLVKDQVDKHDNGLYVVTQPGSGGTPFILTRATNWDQAAEIDSHDQIVIASGTANAGGYFSVNSGKTVQWQAFYLNITNSAIGEWQVELYSTEADGTTPYFQYAIDNYPTFNGFTFNMYQDEISTTEILYTDGDAELSHDAPAPFGASFVWGDRVFLVDTDEPGDVWVSEEKEVGIGYAFSPTLTFNISEGSARLRCGGQVDFNYAALFKEDGIWLISGPGPDKQGRGMYQPTRLPTNLGCVDQASIATTPEGLTFRATDGRRWLITPGRQLVEYNQGVENYRGRSTAGAVFDMDGQQHREMLESDA